ncbi:RNA polymerase sigma factor (sigma-70 family) [Solirubrobacter pauli]|uniref:RNA polymerase sigma factor (Sigma-70 family) n=1 Tax=Solirubrobacter pauli TaxID=166793 RepID=A0A660L996_9ACTN|nr:RNA polymerase sigma factor [Solirubrobacter pauli]RKQ88130.1 RNA polymerase sigma factor (sigma-70 family) [Solirubrobacter pauli]
MTDLFSPHRDAVVRSLERRFGNRELAEDAVQDALAAALASDEAPANPKAWLHVVAHRRAVDALRGTREAPHAEPPELGTACDAAEVVVMRERVRSVLGALHAIPRRQRDALLLRTLEDRSYEEIGARLEVEPENAKQLVSRARRGLRRRVAGALPAPFVARLAELLQVATGTAAGRTCAGLCVAAGAFASLSVEAPVVRQMAVAPAATAEPTATPTPTARPKPRRERPQPRRTPAPTATPVRTAVATPVATPVRTATPTPTPTPSRKDAIVAPRTLPTPTPTPAGYAAQIRKLKRCPRTQEALQACGAEFRAWSIEQSKRLDAPKADRTYSRGGSNNAS